MEQLRGEMQMTSPLSNRSNNGALGTKKPGHLGLVQDVSKNQLKPSPLIIHSSRIKIQAEQDKFWRRVIDDDTRRYRIEKERNQIENHRKNRAV